MLFLTVRSYSLIDPVLIVEARRIHEGSMDGRSPKLQRLCAGTKLQMKQSVTASRKKFIAKGPLS